MDSQRGFCCYTDDRLDMIEEHWNYGSVEHFMTPLEKSYGIMFPGMVHSLTCIPRNDLTIHNLETMCVVVNVGCVYSRMTHNY